MIDETGQNERITELEHKLKHHDRQIAELKYSQLLPEKDRGVMQRRGQSTQARPPGWD
jgi:hypothetical protein